MTYHDEDNSWLDAMVAEVPVAPVHTVKPKTARKGLWQMSPEVCAKISASLKGKAQSAEHTAKISAGKKGRTAWNKGKTMMSAEARAKISAAQKGKQVSKETRAKLSAVHQGKPKTRKN